MYTTKDILTILKLLKSIPEKYESRNHLAAINGAIVGIQKYNENKRDSKLSTYLAWWIKESVEKKEREAFTRLNENITTT